MENKDIKVLCERCQLETNHEVLCSKNRYEVAEGDDSIWETETFMIVKCRGCDNIHMVRKYVFSEDEIEYPDGGYGPEEHIDVYPVPKIGFNRLNNKYEIPTPLRNIYEQTCNSIAVHDYILAGIGLRAIVEAICLMEHIKGKLNKQITTLAKNGIISKNDVEKLHAIRFLGNDAAHKIESPTKRQIEIAIKIIENMLDNKYCMVNEIYKNLDMPYKTYCDFKNYIISKIRAYNCNTEICIDDLWEKEKRRYIIERQPEYDEYLHKIKSEFVNTIDAKEELYFDLDVKYHNKYTIEIVKNDDKLVIIKKTNIDAT